MLHERRCPPVTGTIYSSVAGLFGGRGGSCLAARVRAGTQRYRQQAERIGNGSASSGGASGSLAAEARSRRECAHSKGGGGLPGGKLGAIWVSPANLPR